MCTRRAAGALTSYYDKRFEPMGITVNQFSLMINIKSAGTTNITDLTRMVKLDKSTLSRTLAPLIDDGYIYSQRGRNRREILLTLTEKGQQKMAVAFPAWREMQSEMIELLGGEDEAEKFVDTLIRIQELKRK